MFYKNDPFLRKTLTSDVKELRLLLRGKVLKSYLKNKDTFYRQFEYAAQQNWFYFVKKFRLTSAFINILKF